MLVLIRAGGTVPPLWHVSVLRDIRFLMLWLSVLMRLTMPHVTRLREADLSFSVEESSGTTVPPIRIQLTCTLLLTYRISAMVNGDEVEILRQIGLPFTGYDITVKPGSPT